MSKIFECAFWQELFIYENLEVETTKFKAHTVDLDQIDIVGAENVKVEKSGINMINNIMM